MPNFDDPIYELEALAANGGFSIPKVREETATDVEVEHLTFQRDRILQGWSKTQARLDLTRAVLVMVACGLAAQHIARIRNSAC